MPISIRRPDGSPGLIARLCADEWRLREQAEAFEAWLIDARGRLAPSDYVADLGFSPRGDALGGGAVLPPAMLRAMADLGMTLFLSEYPPDPVEI